MLDYLIIGNGVAGTTAAENVRKTDQEGNITIVTDEDLPFYSRIRLNEFISGDISKQDLVIKKPHWYEELNIDLKLRTRITKALEGEKTLITEDGKKLTFDRLLIATGSRSFIPPIPGADKSGVFSLRKIHDALDIISHTEKAEKAVLIGGGLLGLEAGNALKKIGKSVVVVEFFPRLLPRQLDEAGAMMLQGMMERMGFSFRLGAKTEEIEGGEQTTHVRLEGGERLPGDVVIISAGVRPDMDIAPSLRLECDKGIKVDDRLMTNQPDIYAAGDVAEYKGVSYGIWPAAMEQGKIAGINMAGGKGTYSGTTMANTLKVVGIDLASAGDTDAENKYDSKVHSDTGIYKKIVMEKNRIIGCIMLGDTKGFNQITKAMSGKKEVSVRQDQIISGKFDF